jgi:hypothetical protein
VGPNNNGDATLFEHPLNLVMKILSGGKLPIPPDRIALFLEKAGQFFGLRSIFG